MRLTIVHRMRRGPVLVGALAAITAVLVSAGTASVTAATPEGAGLGTHASPRSDVEVPAEPFFANLVASYGSGGGYLMPTSTRTITAQLPEDVRDFGLTELRFSLDIADDRADGVALISGDTVTVNVPEGFLAPRAGPSDTHAGGTRELYLWIGTQTTRDGVPVPTGTNPQRANLSVGLTTRLILTAPTDATAQYLSLTKDSADTIRYERGFWAAGSTELLGVAGDRFTFTLPPSAVPATATAEFLPVGPPWTPLELTASVDGSSTTVVLPAERVLQPYLDLDAQTNLTITVTSGYKVTQIRLPMTFAHRPVSGTGLTTRLAEYDRYHGSQVMLNAQFQPFTPGVSAPVPVVFFSAGADFPDALSAAAAAAHHGGGLLLIPPGATPDYGILNTFAALGTQREVTVGGYRSVDGLWDTLITQYSGPGGFTRVTGADRFEVSRNVALSEFSDGATTVFLATGSTFSDALSAVPAAASQGAPVILINGSSGGLDAGTLDALQQLGVQNVTLVGGPSSISAGIERQLNASYPGAVLRIGGADRYEVSAAVNRHYFADATEAFLATGATFSDALPGGVLAASRHAPILLVHPDCVPIGTLAALQGWKVEKTTLLGGSASLTSRVLNLEPCR